MKSINDIINENMNLTDCINNHPNIGKCINKVENMPVEYILVMPLNNPYKREYTHIMFQKNFNTNKISAITLIKTNDNANSRKIDFLVIPTHDKTEIDKNIKL